MSIQPYYERDGIVIYHGDCRDILPELEQVDLVLTDPPYGVDYDEWDAEVPYAILPDLLSLSRGAVLWFGASSMLQADLSTFSPPPDRMLIWAPRFSLSNTGRDGLLYRWHPIHAWRLPGSHDGPKHDVLTTSTGGRNWWDHPATKPLDLMRSLVGFAPDRGTILDPFMGSGTTLRAAKDLGRHAVGIEIEERYCEIAARRLEQQVLPIGDIA